MRYLFYTYRYVDRMNMGVEELAAQGWRVHSTQAVFNVLIGQMEYLVCLEREREEGT